jgi:hypothetical protein
MLFVVVLFVIVSVGQEHLYYHSGITAIYIYIHIVHTYIIKNKGVYEQ